MGKHCFEIDVWINEIGEVFFRGVLNYAIVNEKWRYVLGKSINTAVVAKFWS